MPITFPRRTALVAASVLLALAAPAAASARPYVPPQANLAGGPTDENGQPYCPKLEVIIARGTAEGQGSSYALDGYYNNAGSTDWDRNPSTTTQFYAPNQFWPGMPGNIPIPEPQAPVGQRGNLTYGDRNAPWGVWTTIARQLTAPPAGQTPLYEPKDLYRFDAVYPASLLPATPNTTDFWNSATTGYVSVTNELNERNIACPDTKFMLFGYSQGAVVIGNVISQSNKRIFWDWTVPGASNLMRAQVKPNIVAVGLLSNMGFRGHDWVKFNAGTVGPLVPSSTSGPFEYEYDRVVRGTTASTVGGPFYGQLPDQNGRRNDGTYENGRNGGYPRSIQAYYPELAFKVRDVCIYRDPICTNSGSVQEHLYYQGDLTVKQNLATFALSKLACPRDPVSPLAACAAASGASNPPAAGPTPFPDRNTRYPALTISGL